MLDLTGIWLLHCINKNYRIACRTQKVTLVTIDIIQKSSHMKVNNCIRCLNFLVQSGYVKKYEYDVSGPICMGYEPTHKGSHWFQFFTLGSIDFWFKSIIVPILVSFAASWLAQRFIF